MTTVVPKEITDEPQEPQGPLSTIGDVVDHIKDVVDDILEKTDPAEPKKDPDDPKPDPCCGPNNPA